MFLHSSFSAQSFKPISFYGLELGEEQLEHRPHRNQHLRPFTNPYGYVQGVEAKGEVSKIYCRFTPAFVPTPVITDVPYVAPAIVIPISTAVPLPYVAPKPISIPAWGSITGVFAAAQVGEIAGVATGVSRIQSVAGKMLLGEYVAHGGAVATLYSEEAESFVEEISGYGIQNPTDEELALIAVLLTRKAKPRIPQVTKFNRR